MKVAVQISGDFRMLHLCLPKLQTNLLEAFPNTQVDFFVHTWWRETDGIGTFPCAERGEWHNTMVVYGHGVGLAHFKPRGYFLEKYEDRHDLKALPRAYSMYYSIKRANDARKDYENLTETQYDLVMRFRTDCILNENLYDTIKDFIETKESFLCIPQSKQAKGCDGPVESDENGICDWFAIGTPDAMDVYCGTYETWKDTGYPLVPESMLAMQLKSREISRNTILKRPLYDFYLVEGNGMIRGV